MSKEEKSSPPSWFVQHEGKQAGPLSGAKIRGMLLDGELDLSDQVSTDGKEWVALGSVTEVVPLQIRADRGDKQAQKKLAARKASRDEALAEEKRFPKAAIIVLSAIVISIIGIAVWFGMPEEIVSPQCDAQPAPGVNWRNCLLPGRDVGSASLAGANLNSAVLRDGRFSATDFTGADLRYVNLSGADMRYSQLSGVQMVGANLQRADLRGSDLTKANLKFADLRGSLIESAVFEGASLQGAIWTDGKTCSDKSVGRCVPILP
jgi:hypothetical protein